MQNIRISYLRRLAAPAAIATAALAVAVPGIASAATAKPSKSLTTINIGAVPTDDLGALQLGIKEGYFKQAGISIKLTPNDNGPQIITGLVAGQYQMAFTAYAPPLLAEAQGAKLRLVLNIDSSGPNGTNGIVIVKKGSGITSFKDLSGATLGANAARSALVLYTQAAIGKAGGNGSSITPVALPFNEIAQEVESGQIKAGVLLQPYQSAALAQYPDLVNLGDPSYAAFPNGTPAGGLFATVAWATAHKSLLTSFDAAYTESVTYANAHLAQAKSLGLAFSGVPASQGKVIPFWKFPTKQPTSFNFAATVNAMLKYGWISSKPNLTSFVGK